MKQQLSTEEKNPGIAKCTISLQRSAIEMCQSVYWPHVGMSGKHNMKGRRALRHKLDHVAVGQHTGSTAEKRRALPSRPPQCLPSCTCRFMNDRSTCRLTFGVKEIVLVRTFRHLCHLHLHPTAEAKKNPILLQVACCGASALRVTTQSQWIAIQSMARYCLWGK